jgi:hypothetical protein
MKSLKDSLLFSYNIRYRLFFSLKFDASKKKKAGKNRKKFKKYYYNPHILWDELQ